MREIEVRKKKKKKEGIMKYAVITSAVLSSKTSISSFANRADGRKSLRRIHSRNDVTAIMTRFFKI